MARANIYLPDELARAWRTAGRINLSQITQIAMRRELARSNTDLWLQRIAAQRGWYASHEDVLGALREDAAVAGGES